MSCAMDKSSVKLLHPLKDLSASVSCYIALRSLPMCLIFGYQNNIFSFFSILRLEGLILTMHVTHAITQMFVLSEEVKRLNKEVRLGLFVSI